MTDGPDEGYEAYFDTDGDSTTDFTLELESSDTSKYEYVSRFYQENADGSTDYDTLGVLGVTTTGDDVPTSGSATYTGEASGGYVTSDGSSKQAIMGDMTASADFGAGTVDVTVSNLTGYDEATNSADTSADLLFDSASASMVLNSSYRNNFYNENSSDVTYSKNGSEVDISSFTGSDNTNSASGSFYGFDTTDGNPAEIGGSITSEGSDGQVIVNYVGAKTE